MAALAETPPHKKIETVYTMEDQHWRTDNEFYNLSKVLVLPYTDISLELLDDNDRFVILSRKLEAQFEELSDYYDDIKFYELRAIFSTICSTLLNLNPDKISVELSHHDSIVFTLKRENYTIFFERYLNPDSSEEEVIYSGFNEDQKIPSYSGNFKLAHYYLSRELSVL